MTFDVHESDRPWAETVLLSSGLGGAAGYWAPQLAALKRRYRVITYDQTGTGRARSTELSVGHSISDMADKVIEILDATDTESCHFVGHALGGLIGLDLAARMPDRLQSLSVVNGWAVADAHTRRCFEIRLALLKQAGIEAYVRAQPIFLYPAAWLAANEARMVQEDAHALAGFQGVNNLIRRIEALLRFDASAYLPDLKLPVLLVAAKDDVLVPYTQSERLSQALDGGVLRIGAWGGHAMNVTDPERFNAVLLDFLAAHAGGGTIVPFGRLAQ
ncbi:aminoacrylate hydrolase [Enhydrobacter aerosaccus]|uniref:Putative carbamate hydrolase RutD n=1 Tax=Enhydrobacter aerosaccus TaxID=225324 RepID=A0A1T4NWN3_9HYPH|nr:pyrimidine utilization protein D [Enhydrobacter aerosaccus]SJZ83452.1 aminoacrylate hydrolase [Enhydrobacter aerosaccus]